MTYLVDTVSRRVLILSRWFGKGDERGANLKTLDGNVWVLRERQLRRPMPAEVRVAIRRHRHNR